MQLVFYSLSSENHIFCCCLVAGDAIAANCFFHAVLLFITLVPSERSQLSLRTILTDAVWSVTQRIGNVPKLIIPFLLLCKLTISPITCRILLNHSYCLFLMCALRSGHLTPFEISACHNPAHSRPRSMASREDLVFHAKIAEQLERYPELVCFRSSDHWLFLSQRRPVR